LIIEAIEEEIICPNCNTKQKIRKVSKIMSPRYMLWEKKKRGEAPQKYLIFNSPRIEYVNAIDGICPGCRAKKLKLQQGINETGMPPLYYNKTFNNYEIYCNEQVKLFHYIGMVSKLPLITLFIGYCGTGKTHLAAATINSLLKIKKIKYFIFADLLVEIRNTYAGNNDSEYEILKRINKTDLIILDEIGLEKQSDFTNRILYQIVNTRINFNKPTILISNMEISLFASLIKKIDERLYSRLFAVQNYVFSFTWDDYRLRKPSNKKLKFLGHSTFNLKE
jgi:DNA replication protein DnaC